MAQADETIVAHHVGGRGFGVAFNTPPVFDSDIAHVLYEADPACAATMQAENKRRNVFVLPYCLAERDGDATLHVTANPYASSLLSPSADYAKYYCEVMLSGELEGVDVQGAYYDALYRKENKVVGIQLVPTRSLDSLAAENALPLGRLPDFLSLDTQGSEHAILQGARDVVGRSVLAIATEIEFHPMYDRQPLFSALLDLATNDGFHFAGFTHLQEISSHRAPVGQRAKGFVAFGDAIFLRSLETLERMPGTPEERHLKALKLAFIALNFGYLEYALQVLEHALRYPGPEGIAKRPNTACYVGFLLALQRAAAEMPRVYLQGTRAALVDQLRTRYQRHPWIGALRRRLRPFADRLRRLSERNPLVQLFFLILLVFTRLFQRAIGSALALVEGRLGPGRAMGAQSASHFGARYSPVEAVLGEYKFYWVRDEVRRRRRAAQPFYPSRRL
jgi:FkbM family methyltransferase